jgi:hypothetical protein
MAKKKNVFTDAWIVFHNAAVDLSHLLSFLPWQLKMARKLTQQSLDVLEKRGLKGNFGAATGLSIIDVFREGEFTYRAPAGKRSTGGDDIERMLSEVEGRFNNSVLLSLHEALEAYVKKLFEAMLYQLRNDRPLRDKSSFHSAIKNAFKHRGTPEYYRLYVHWSCRRDCRYAWDALRDELDWSIVKQDGWLGMDWITVADTLSMCRNFIAHDEGRVADERWTEMSRQRKEFIESLMSESMLTTERRILAGRDQAYRFLEAIVSVGYGVYVLLSNRFGMKLDVKLGTIQHSAQK